MTPEQTERLARQARIHAKAVEVIAAKLRGRVIGIEHRVDIARAILAEFSAAGLLVGTADEFKE